MTNVRTNLASFWRFSVTANSLPSRLTDHYSLAIRHLLHLHVARPTIVGGRRRCRAPSRVQHSHPAGVNMLHNATFSGFRQKFSELGFRRNLTWKWDLRPFLSRLSSDATLDLIKYLKRCYAVMSHVADSPKNRHFEPISGRFTPIRLTNHR